QRCRRQGNPVRYYPIDRHRTNTQLIQPIYTYHPHLPGAGACPCEGAGCMKVLIGANFMGLEAGIPALQQEFPDVEFVYCPERDQIGSMIGDADVYMGWLSREAFLAAKKLKWIQSPSSGVNYYLDIPELVASDVLLTSAAGTHGAAVAESAMAMSLAFTRGVRSAIIDQPSKAWNNRSIRPTMMELTGTVMGIVGAGSIGRA